MSLITSDSLQIIVGLGKTGLSCARYLISKGRRFAVVDTRAEPPGTEELRLLAPEVELRCGPLEVEFLSRATELIVSPGVSCAEPALQQAKDNGVELIGDIELFCRDVEAAVVAITGSNAKSTVTTLVGEMAAEAGVDVGVGGNLGLPALDLLSQGPKQLYVLELSSFQLETTHQLRAEVATVLNISPDHMDRYDDLQGYYHAKQRVYRGCKHAVVNRDDALSAPLLPMGIKQTSFSPSKPDLKDFGVIEHEGQRWLARGLEPLMPVHALKIRGEHNLANALAAMALASVVAIPVDAMVAVLQRFAGLEHRCQWIRELDGVHYFNDSKGTNVGATVAALDGYGPSLPPGEKIILIAGGDGKGADFSELKDPISNYARAVVLIGRDGPLIDSIIEVPKVYADDMADAVGKAKQLAQAGDLVLLSPACASFDMFASFNQRGEVFAAEVRAL